MIRRSKSGARGRRVEFNDKGMKPETKEIKPAQEILDKMGPPSMFICPECKGPLWEIREDNASLYRCLVGHAYGPENLFEAQSEEVERALWVALRTLEERVELHRQLSQRAEALHQTYSSSQFSARSQEYARHAKVIRQVLEQL